ncbi:MAG: YeeE/YedE family protein [Nitrospirae bacterium]|nr:YeeE/YedE family protein [Nitrospirota bacterium]MBF0520147.1 YeeE/YedE family protein [Nitrospirota bacterium]MBF0536319.1 YeeE/YedE family protein [Nitrospirota bacterium]MBF0618260.1 YeeE/YedE family protein [Nitrospirota bacterium]
MFFLRRKEWMPIGTGILFGLLEVLSFYMSDRPLGSSRGYTTIGSIIEYVFFPAHAQKVAYWQLYEPYLEWTITLIAGIVFGSFVSSLMSGQFKFTLVPDMWKTTMKSSVSNRWFWAFIGGVLVGFGSRLAMGCTLGMLIAGVIQLAPAGFIFMMSLWMGGLGATALFYRLRTFTFRRG